MNNEIQVEIQTTEDVVNARQRGRTFALGMGFTGPDVTVIAAVIAEIARNIVDYAKKGKMTMSRIQKGNKPGIQIVAEDRGPGIPDVAQAMEYGYSTRQGLGVGLPGAKWLMDEFDLFSEVGIGTKVVMKKLLR